MGAVCALSTAPAVAQHPNHATGFRPEHTFQLGDIENVNLFNGNLTLTIPIGQRYPLGPELSYGLTLVYTGNVWEWEEESDPGSKKPYLKSVPRTHSNAGLGWDLSLGRWLAKNDPANSNVYPAYQSPDQALHALIATRLHPVVGAEQFSGISFTRDGTYLRYIRDDSTVEFPDGSVHRFGSAGRVRSIMDRFGHELTVSYSDFDSNLNEPKIWTLSDTRGRSHSVHLVKRRGRLVIDTVVLDGFEGGTTTYRFSYSDRQIPRPCNHPVLCDDGEPAGEDFCGTTDSVWQPVLTGVEVVGVEDQTDFSIPAGDYITDHVDACPSEARQLNGHLESLDLPTGGGYEWAWELKTFPPASVDLDDISHPAPKPDSPFRRSAGVATRRHITRSGGTLGFWTYVHKLQPVDGISDKELEVTVTASPNGEQTKHYFSVYSGDPQTSVPGGWTQYEYGLPFTRRTTDGSSPGRFLSRQIYDKNGSLLRSVYVRYERSGDSDANPRLVSRRTVYHDDGGRRADLDLSDFDGLGHHRRQVTSGNFTGQNSRTTVTNYNPGRSMTDIPDETEPWILGTFDHRSVTEGGQTVRQDFWFDLTGAGAKLIPGALRRTRTRRGTFGGCTADDVVVDYNHFGASQQPKQGFVSREDFYGGDGAGLSTSCASLKDLDLSQATLRYRRRHDYACGVLASTRWHKPWNDEALTFLSVDRSIDCSTGLVSASRDTAGLQASFSYDRLGRLASVDPPAGEADTVYLYEGETSSRGAQVTVQRKSGSSVLSQEQVRFDGFGRVATERRQLPNGTWAERDTDWSSRGWIDQRTEWEPAGDGVRSATKFRQYDPFGRPGQVTLPDDQVITIEYAGVGSRTIKVPVATSGTGISLASTTEVYDRFGRLADLYEPSGTRTNYSYDAQDNLTLVRMNLGGSPIQTRSFGYDGRGFLTSESHPELGTSVVYSGYDPLGNPGRIRRGGWDLGYTYDPAGRLTEIRNRATQEVWKEWTFATANGQAGSRSNGKLREAVRHNRIRHPATGAILDIPVTETYTYDGLGGRISGVSSVTAVGTPGVDRPTFDYALSYDALGNVASRSYPQCRHLHCSAKNVPRTISQVFTRGHLTSIPGYASSIGYHANGLISLVAHANGVTWSQAKDPNDMQRPQRISTSGASDDLDSGIYAYDGAGNVTAMGPDRYTYDVLSRVSKANLEVSGAACGDQTTVQGTTDTGTRDYESCGTVQMGPSYTVGSSGDVTARAGERVVLADGFSVASGGRFTAEVDPSLVPSVLHERQYGYDLFGNLTSHTTTVDGGSGDLQTMPVNDDTNRLSAASYDLSGNVTWWGGWSYDHDPFNMLRETNGHTFVYGPGDERIWSVDWTAGTDPKVWKETWTLRDLDGRPLRQFRGKDENANADSWTLWRDYVWRGATLLAAQTPNGAIHYHPDHLGTPRLITDSSGSTVARHLYFPYGEEATNSLQNPEVLKFTGHERDDLDPGGGTADLDYMHARYFSAHLGRFMSVDPVVASPGVPQGWNRYAYVQNNPVNFVDPRGLFGASFFFLFNGLPIAEIDGGTTTVTGQAPSFNPLTGLQGLSSLLSGRSLLNAVGFTLFGAVQAPAAPPQWVNPTGNCIRSCDSFGCGGFGASRDGGRRQHQGADFLATPGQDVVAPTSGTLTRAVNRVYANDPRYTGFVLSGQNGFAMKAFYVATDPSLIGNQVSAGDVLGTAQDLGAKYPGISNHVHLQIENPQRQLIDPANVVPLPSQCP